MTKLGTKWPNWVQNDQNENKTGYEMTKIILNKNINIGTK